MIRFVEKKRNLILISALGKVIEEKSGLEERLLKGLEIIGGRNKALEKELEALRQ
jgi:hypothetical protein